MLDEDLGPVPPPKYDPPAEPVWVTDRRHDDAWHYEMVRITDAASRHRGFNPVDPLYDEENPVWSDD